MRIQSGEVSRTEFIEGPEVIVRSWNKPLLTNYLLNIDDAAGPVLGSRNTVIDKSGAFPAFGELILLGVRTNNNSCKSYI